MRAFDQFRPTQPNPTQCFSDPSDEDLLGHGCQSFFALLPEASHRMPFASSKLFQSARTRNLRDVAYLAITIWALAYLIIAGGAYVFSAHPPYDARGLLLGLDFVNTWASGRAALTGNPATWFDASVYNTALHATFGPSFPTISQWFNNWSYPPDILLFTWVLGLLPYFPAYTLWSIIGFAIYYFVVTNNEGRFDRILFLAAAPAVTSNLLSGQNGFFTAALMIGGLSKLDKNPVLAGIFFGLLTLKPQLCLLVPVMLCVTRQWRCIAAAGATVLILAATTSVIFGIEVWESYFRIALPIQNTVLREGRGFIAYMPTIFMNARLLGLTPDFAWFVQAPVSVGALSVVVWTFWKRRDRDLSRAVFITASLVATPYMFTHDMVMLVWIVAHLRERTDGTIWDDILAVAVWILPAAAGPLGLAGVPVSAVVLLAFLVRLVFRLSNDHIPHNDFLPGSAHGEISLVQKKLYISKSKRSNRYLFIWCQHSGHTLVITCPFRKPHQCDWVHVLFGS